MGGKGKIGRAILGVIGAAGLVAVSVVAPNALRALSIFDVGERKYFYRRNRQVNKAIQRLKKKKMIRFVEKNDKRYFELTDLGRQEFYKNKLADFEPVKPRKWDKKWRVVIFDINEQRRGKRDDLRIRLSNIGFIKLQNSVWVYPYRCDEMIFMVKTAYSLGKEVLYMTVDEIENDKWLKEEFGLKT